MNASADTSNSSPALLALQSQISTLTDLYSQIKSIRTIPPLLLHPHPHPSSSPPPLQELKDFAQTLKSDLVQGALKAAGDSERGDGKAIVGGRRESRKRRRPPSPKSPQPYRPFSYNHYSRSLFPTDPSSPPITITSLPAYIREFNKSHSPSSQLHIYLRNFLPNRPLKHEDGAMDVHSKYDDELTKNPPNPIIVRYCIVDVLTAFIKFSCDDGLRGPLVVETITAIGPRERKSPHSQSDYMAYQNLSQQLAKTIHEEPGVGVRSIMALLTQYSTLFTARCTSCQRVLSAEGHVPPVVRVWVPDLRRISVTGGGPGAGAGAGSGTIEEKAGEKRAEREVEKGRWDARHVGCLGSC